LSGANLRISEDLQGLFNASTSLRKIVEELTLPTKIIEIQNILKANHKYNLDPFSNHSEVNESVPESLKEIEPSLDVKDFISLSIDIKKDLYEFFSNPEFKKTKDVIGKAITDIKQLEKAFSDIAVASKSAEFYVPGKIKIDSLPDFIKQYASTTLVPMASARGFSVDSVKDVNSYKQFLLEAWDGIRDMNYD
jgi:hypothetical protein